MSKLIGFVVVIAFVAFVAALLKKKNIGDVSGEWSFYPRKPLSGLEQVLFFRLSKALPEHIILAQVQLSS